LARFYPECGQRLGDLAVSPHSYTPTYLAEKILTSKSALEGERKQVTVLFADLKGSMELLADRDPEEAHQLLDPVLECIMEAVHHYEGTVNQVMGDGIMALFGAPIATREGVAGGGVWRRGRGANAVWSSYPFSLRCLLLPYRLLLRRRRAVMQMYRMLRVRQGNAVLIKGELDLFWHTEADLPEIGLLHPHPDDQIDTAIAQCRDTNKGRRFFEDGGVLSNQGGEHLLHLPEVIIVGHPDGEIHTSRRRHRIIRDNPIGDFRVGDNQAQVVGGMQGGRQNLHVLYGALDAGRANKVALFEGAKNDEQESGRQVGE
jgi:Adenylate and Guanylate cyclase catalytic domain